MTFNTPQKKSALYTKADFYKYYRCCTYFLTYKTPFLHFLIFKLPLR